MCRNHHVVHGPPAAGASSPPMFDNSSQFSSSSIATLHDPPPPSPRAQTHMHPMATSTSTSAATASDREREFREFHPGHGGRRRSVDVGGLALALGAVQLGDTGMGWGGWDENENCGALFAELLSDMYTQTQTAVNMPVLSPLPEISPATRARLIDALDSWHFEPHRLPDEEVLACTQLLFEALFRIEGMRETVGVSLAQIGAFLLHLRAAYRASNSYHNFQHALDVFQATHMYLRAAGAVPPVAILHLPDPESVERVGDFNRMNGLNSVNGSKGNKGSYGKAGARATGRWRPDAEVRATWVGILRQEDIFALYIAAVGHDVGHPGFNNMFMKNAQAPLSQVYDHKSALEQMHCAFLLPIMKRHGLAHLLDPPRTQSPPSVSPFTSPFQQSAQAPQQQGAQSNAHSGFRKLLLETVLATDMGVHNQFMARFTRLMDAPHEFDIVQARILVCQALIKCADISNPSRPHTVSQHWSAALAAEWASQALLEKQLSLPVSVQDSDDPVTEARGQVSFITIFCSPLLEVTCIAVPEMKCFSEQCATNCSLWRTRLSSLQELQERQAREAQAAEPNYPPVPYRAVSPPQPLDYLSVFPLSLPPHVLECGGSSAGGGGGLGGGVGRNLNMNSDKVRDADGDDEMDGVHSDSVSFAAGTGPGESPKLISRGGLNGHAQYDGHGAPSSRSPSPSNDSSPTSASPPQGLSQRPLPPISTQVVPSFSGGAFSPLDFSSPATASGTSTSGSPRSEWAPRTPGSSSGRPGSSRAGSVSGLSAGSGLGGLGGLGVGMGGLPTEPMSSIRAAYKLSVRKKKSFHRNSWTPSPSSLSPYSAFPANLGANVTAASSPLSTASVRLNGVGGEIEMPASMGPTPAGSGDDTTMSET